MTFGTFRRVWRRRLTRLRARLAGRDLAWKPTGISQRFTGHDERLAKASAERAAIQSEQRRINEARRSNPVRAEPVKPPRKRANVVEMRRAK